jgi:hypothetical protein
MSCGQIEACGTRVKTLAYSLSRQIQLGKIRIKAGNLVKTLAYSLSRQIQECVYAEGKCITHPV